MSAKSDQKSSSDTYLEHDSTSSCKRNRIRTTSAEKINQRKYESNKYLDEEEKVEKERERKKDHHHINHESKISHVAESKVDKFHRNITNSDYDEEDVLVNGKSSVYKTKESLDEIEEADREFENLMRKPNEGTIAPPTNPLAKLIMDGFQINQMNMRDANTGELLWTSRRWTPEDMLDDIMEARIPKEILECDAVAREINFSSREQIQNFRLVQRIFVHGTCLEEWSFQFGFVIPGSTNSWQQTIYAAPRSKMIPAEVLSGNTTIETSFYDGDLLIAKTLLRLYYE